MRQLDLTKTSKKAVSNSKEEANGSSELVGTYNEVTRDWETSWSDGVKFKNKEKEPYVNIPYVQGSWKSVATLPNYEGIVDSPTALKFAALVKDKDYDLGAKGIANWTNANGKHKTKVDSIDCSGAVCVVKNAMGDDFSLVNTGAAKFGSIAKTKGIKPEESLDGDMIVMKTKGKGINHIGLIIVDDQGRRYIAESSSSYNGTTITPYEDRIKDLKKNNSKFSYDIVSEKSTEERTKPKKYNTNYDHTLETDKEKQVKPSLKILDESKESGKKGDIPTNAIKSNWSNKAYKEFKNSMATMAGIESPGLKEYMVEPTETDPPYEKSQAVLDLETQIGELPNSGSKEDTNEIVRLNEKHDLLVAKEKELANINKLDDNGKRTGVWKEYYSNNRLAQETNYKNGELDGLAKQYHESGNLLSEGNYVNGKADGEWVYSRDDGTREQEIGYKNGEISINKKYSDKGKIKEKETFVNGKSTGVSDYDEEGVKIVGKPTAEDATAEVAIDPNIDATSKAVDDTEIDPDIDATSKAGDDTEVAIVDDTVDNVYTPVNNTPKTYSLNGKDVTQAEFQAYEKDKNAGYESGRGDGKGGYATPESIATQKQNNLNAINQQVKNSIPYGSKEHINDLGLGGSSSEGLATTGSIDDFDPDKIKQQIADNKELLNNLGNRKPFEYESKTEWDNDLGGTIADAGRGIVGMIGANKELPVYQRGNMFQTSMDELTQRRNMGLTDTEKDFARNMAERGYGYDVKNIGKFAGGSAGVALGNLGRATGQLYDEYGQLAVRDEAVRRQNRADFNRGALSDEQVNRQIFVDELTQAERTKAAGAALVQDATKNMKDRAQYNKAYGPGSQMYEYNEQLIKDKESSIFYREQANADRVVENTQELNRKIAADEKLLYDKTGGLSNAVTLGGDTPEISETYDNTSQLGEDFDYDGKMEEIDRLFNGGLIGEEDRNKFKSEIQNEADKLSANYSPTDKRPIEEVVEQETVVDEPVVDEIAPDVVTPEVVTPDVVTPDEVVAEEFNPNEFSDTEENVPLENKTPEEKATIISNEKSKEITAALSPETSSLIDSYIDEEKQDLDAINNSNMSDLNKRIQQDVIKQRSKSREESLKKDPSGKSYLKEQIAEMEKFKKQDEEDGYTGNNWDEKIQKAKGLNLENKKVSREDQSFEDKLNDYKMELSQDKETLDRYEKDPIAFLEDDIRGWESEPNSEKKTESLKNLRENLEIIKDKKKFINWKNNNPPGSTGNPGRGISMEEWIEIYRKNPNSFDVAKFVETEVKPKPKPKKVYSKDDGEIRYDEESINDSEAGFLGES